MKRLLSTLCLVWAVVGLCLAQRTVRGTVSGDDGETLIGATVLVKGTATGTRTDAAGNYSLLVPADVTTPILVISYTGYQTQEITLGASNDVSVILPAGQLLQEAVVTALGISREEKSLAYSVQQIDGDQLTQARDANIVNALSGKIAGVNVTSSSGNVGSSSRIIIRGATSITGENQPLFVVNGVPVDNSSKTYASDPRGAMYGGVDYGNAISDINPDDVESISVLKGPNAAALYGSRGANGVILITTKSGRNAAKGLGVSYTGDVGFATPFRLPDYQNEYGQGVGQQFRYVDGAGGGLNDGVDESWGPAFNTAINEQDGIDNDDDGTTDEQGEAAFMDQFTGANQPWQAFPNSIRDAFDTGVSFTNSVAITAAGDKAHARFSFTNLDQQGMVPNTDLKRNNFNLGFGIDMSEKLALDGNVGYTALKSNNRPGVGYIGDNILLQSIWVGRQVDWDYLRAHYNERDAMGRIVNWNHNYENNPFFTLYNNLKPQQRDRVNGQVSLSYKLLSWLKATGRVGTDFYDDRREVHYRHESIDFPNGRYETQNYRLNETNTDILLTADKYISDNFSITATAGVARRDFRFRGLEQKATSLVVDGLFNFSNSGGAVEIKEYLNRLRINSVLGNVSFGFLNFIYLDVSGRNDWTSTLPAENRSYFYPGVNLSLVLSEKLNIPGINFLKIRGGYAEAGKDTDPYRLLPTYSPNVPWGGTPSFTLPNDLPNNELKPERSESIEAGIEIRGWRDRIRLDVTYYDTRNIDQIIPLNVSATTGYTSRFINAGTIHNDGFEVQLGLTPVRLNDFSWDIDFNWAKNNSQVEDLPEGVTEITLNTYWGLRLVAREGEAYGTLVGSRVRRTAEGQIIVNAATGRPIYDVDANGNTTNWNLGTITPDWVGGVRNTFSWRGLSLSALIDMRQGSDVFSMSYIFGRYAGVLEETLDGRRTVDEIQNGFIPENTVMLQADGSIVPNTKKVSAEGWNADFYSRRHDRGVFDGSFVKLREVRIGYNFPKTWFASTPIGGLGLAVYGRNLALLHSNVPHIDPETAFDNSTAMQGIEFGQLPSARTFGITLNAEF